MRVAATHSIPLLVLAACVCLTPIHADEPPKDGPAKPPELKELDRLVGSWDTDLTFKPSVWQPEGRRVKGSVTSQWTLGGRFVREQGRSVHEDVEHTYMATYDAEKMAYRSWFFDSTGASNEWRGRWDGDTKTLAWEADLGDGIKAVSKHHFTDADHYEVEVLAKGRDGKVYMDMQAKHTRRK
jgi:hypothetical protein